MSVEDINQFRMKVKGSTMFFGCPCGGESGWQLTCVASGDKPIISGIVCMDCGEEKGVAYGGVES